MEVEMRKLMVLVMLLGLFGAGAAAEEATDADSAAIKATVANYLEGWFSSDAGRMEKALHPNLAKYTVRKTRDGSAEYLGRMTAEELIVLASRNQDWVKGKKTHEMKIVYQDEQIAIVHAVSDGFYDLCNLAKINGEWKIVQVLWGPNDLGK